MTGENKKQNRFRTGTGKQRTITKLLLNWTPTRCDVRMLCRVSSLNARCPGKADPAQRRGILSHDPFKGRQTDRTRAVFRIRVLLSGPGSDFFS